MAKVVVDSILLHNALRYLPETVATQLRKSAKKVVTSLVWTEDDLGSLVQVELETGYPKRRVSAEEQRAIVMNLLDADGHDAAVEGVNESLEQLVNRYVSELFAEKGGK